MTNNKSRIGNFTSSEIVALMAEPTAAAKNKGAIFGKPALTYIEETNFERKLGRSITEESNARPLVWGKLLESFWFDQLGLEYTLSSTETDVHPEIPYWSGSKDGIKTDTVIDIKSPITLKSFCQLVDPLYRGLTGMDAMNAIRDNHKDGEKYYFQLVSNSIINKTKYAELIVGVPYYSQLQEVKQLADGQPNCYWIAMALENELPYLPDGGYYKNLNIIRFEVPEEDKALLTNRVIQAGKMLINIDQDEPAAAVAANEQTSAYDINNIPLIKL